MQPWKTPLLFLVLAAVIVESVVLVQRAMFPYWPEGLAVVGESEAYAAGALAPLSPLLLFVLLYVRPFASVARMMVKARIVGSAVSSLADPMFSFARALGSAYREDMGRVRVLARPYWLLGISIASSVGLGVFPYRADTNPTGSLVGVDSGLYADWFRSMEGRTAGEVVRYAFADAAFGSRPLFLIPALAVGRVFSIGSEGLVRVLPMVLGPLLAVCTFLFVRSGMKNEMVGGLAALLTVFSFSFTVGLWGGYYANWLALAETYLFFAVLIRFHERPSFLVLVGMSLLSLVILFTHPWTWVLVGVVGLLFSFNFRGERPATVWNWSIVPIITLGIGADVLKEAVFGSRTIVEDLATKTPVLGVDQLVVFWPNVVDSLLYTHGGLLANSVFLVLSMLGVVGLRYGDPFQRLLIFWIVIGGILLAFSNSYHQARIVYDLPVPALMAFGLVGLVSVLGRRGNAWPGLVVVVVVLYAAGYALGSLVLL